MCAMHQPVISASLVGNGIYLVYNLANCLSTIFSSNLLPRIVKGVFRHFLPQLPRVLIFNFHDVNTWLLPILCMFVFSNECDIILGSSCGRSVPVAIIAST